MMTQICLSSTEWAYIAGILDGEGNIGASISNGGLMTYISVGNTNPKLIQFLTSKLGGGNSTRDATETWKACHRWDLTERSTLELVLREVLPYLILKQEQAELLLEILEFTKNKKGFRFQDDEEYQRALLIVRLQALNKKGV
jgi:hypothetical protein